MKLFYKCLPQKVYESEEYVYGAVQHEDIESIRQWRNEQMDVLRQSDTIGWEEQIEYFKNNVWSEIGKVQPNKILLSIKIDGKLIGYGGLVNISWLNLRAEISFLVDRNFAPSDEKQAKSFQKFLRFITNLAFVELSLNRLFGELFDIRPIYKRVFEKEGYIKEGVLRENNVINFKKVDSLVYSILNNSDLNNSKSRLTKHNLLITSISKKIPLIKSVRLSVKKIDKSIKIFGGDSNDLCIGKYFVDEFWNMPIIEELSVETLVKFCNQKNIRLIIPTRDGELEYFSHIKDQLEKNKIIVLSSKKETVKTCLDKLKFSRLDGINAIPTSENIEDLDSDRFVVKERFGSGAKKIGINLKKEEALKHCDFLDYAIFQPYIIGQEISVDAYITRENKVKGIVMRRRELIIDGESQITTTFQDVNLEKKFKKILQSLHLYGHAILQAIISNEGDLYVIECNARFGGASTLSIAAGLDSFCWAYLEATGSKIVDYPFMRSQKDITQVRYPNDIHI